VHETLGFEKYGRYVDDFYLIGDKDKILNSIPLMREKLKEVGVKLHPDKFYMQHVSKGCEMVGAVVKKNRMYVHNRTVNNAFRKIERMTSHKRSATEKDLASVNSYLGFMGMYSSYNIRRKLAIQAMKLGGLSAPNNYKKMNLNKNQHEKN
jgi:RNA-directed DNA polymerase